MQTEHEDTIQPGPEAPEDQAREVVEAMRARGTLTPAIEQAFIAGSRRHARFIVRLEDALNVDQSARSF